jgi:hypothetical protein
MKLGKQNLRYLDLNMHKKPREFETRRVIIMGITPASEIQLSLFSKRIPGIILL